MLGMEALADQAALHVDHGDDDGVDGPGFHRPLELRKVEVAGHDPPLHAAAASPVARRRGAVHPILLIRRHRAREARLGSRGGSVRFPAQRRRTGGLARLSGLGGNSLYARESSDNGERCRDCG
jgi:hypothetical protein